MRKLLDLGIAITMALAMVASQSGVANAATVVARVSGGGMAVMLDGMGDSSFGFEATLYSDGTARGHFDCVDQVGDAPGYPGNIFGAITRWSRNADSTINLYVTDAKLVSIPNGLVIPGGLPFTVTILAYGGAGVGHWTLAVPGVPSPRGGPICDELLTSGQIAIRWN
ncbi:MAG: hypothetical protein ABJB39_00050 [Chloroflexota bacterium]